METAAFVVSVFALLVAGGALWITRQEHIAKQRERSATAHLRLHARLTGGDEDGVLRTDATSVTVRLASAIENTGDRAAGLTTLRVRLPWRFNGAYWSDGAGYPREGEERMAPAEEASIGQEPAGSMTTVIASIARGGEAMRYLRFSVDLGVGAGHVPVHITAQADEAAESASLRESLRFERRAPV